MHNAWCSIECGGKIKQQEGIYKLWFNNFQLITKLVVQSFVDLILDNNSQLRDLKY